MRTSLLCILAFAAFFIADAWAQSLPAPASPQQPAQVQPQQTFQDLPWAIRLGLRSHQVSEAIPLIDRVVLVPDGATFLDEISKWSPHAGVGGRWPVLIEDDLYAPMFVRRFAPKQLIRREANGIPLPDDRLAKQRAMEAVVVKAFGGDAARQTPRDVFAQHRYAPPGVVITSAEDPAWPAAVALAAGRGQLLVWLDGNFGDPNTPIDHELAARLIASIHDVIAKQNYTFDSLGDELDAITICRAMATSAHYKPKGGGPPNIPAAQATGPLALTDLIGRKDDGARFACTGWIFGSEARSAYMAMCSLFLPRENAVMFNGYPPDGPWASYGMTDGIALLRQASFNVSEFAGQSADEKSWQRMLMGGVSSDIFVMNTKGNSDYFELTSGTAWFPDVPTLNAPVALHLIHSWSMQAPGAIATVGGQWLESGAYAAVGSCWEPMLSAFVPPNAVANRLVNYVPFLVAARWWDGEPGIAQPWRVVTIGDPLMLCPPPSHVKKQRIDMPAEYGIDLHERVKLLMRDAASDAEHRNGAAAAEALSILNMLGKDQVAAGIWNLAKQRGHSARAARPALDVFFRLRDLENFLDAWEQTNTRDDRSLDMLWHLAYPRLGPGTAGANRHALTHLELAIRSNAIQHDVARLAPHLAQAFGITHVRQFIERHMPRVDANARNALRELMKKY